MYQPESYRFKYAPEQATAIREALVQAGFSRKSDWRNLKMRSRTLLAWLR